MDNTGASETLMTLIHDNQRIIFKICNGYCKNKGEREDLAQEIIYHLLKSGKHFSPDNKFSTWMYRVALNVAISFYRRKLTNPVFSFRENYPEIPDNIGESEELEEDIIHLNRFIADLKEMDRAIMLLYLEEKTYKEIAEIVGISETNTATKISRIKVELKRHFHRIKN